jgi:lipid II:glycine glycyltransferase (peptidoglycan interpeptide bridge formation enzyme)
MTIRFASQTEIDNWNNLIITNPDGGNIFQAKEFATIKGNNSWEPLYVSTNNLYILVLQRKIPLLGKFWYIPKGPGISSINELKKILPALRDFAKNQGVFTVKLEP